MGRLVFYEIELHGQRVTNALEGIVNLFAERGEDSNYDDGNEGNDDRIFN